MDSLSWVMLENSAEVRKDSFETSRLMRGAQKALQICIFQANKENPSLKAIEMLEQFAKKKLKRSKAIVLDIKEDRSVADREMGRLINRFGAQNITALLIKQHRAFIMAEQRARSFTKNTAEAVKRIGRIKASLVKAASGKWRKWKIHNRKQ